MVDLRLLSTAFLAIVRRLLLVTAWRRFVNNTVIYLTLHVICGTVLSRSPPERVPAGLPERRTSATLSGVPGGRTFRTPLSGQLAGKLMRT
jgi:hypothetical protein